MRPYVWDTFTNNHPNRVLAQQNGGRRRPTGFKPADPSANIVAKVRPVAIDTQFLWDKKIVLPYRSRINVEDATDTSDPLRYGRGMAEANFSVYKVSKEVENSVELLAEFVTEEDADEYAGYEQKNDLTNDFEYFVKETKK
jgi:hypothetical protein